MLTFADSSLLFRAIRFPMVSFLLRVSCGLLCCLFFVDVIAAQDGGEIGAEAEARVWTDSKGREVEATFLRMDEKNVVLRRVKDGKEFPFPIRDLTRDDRSVAIKMAIQQRKAERAKRAAEIAPLDSDSQSDESPASEPNAVPDRFDSPDDTPAPRSDFASGDAPDEARKRIEELLDRSRRPRTSFGPDSIMQRGRDRHNQMIEDARSRHRNFTSGRGIGVPSTPRLARPSSGFPSTPRLARPGSGFPSNPGLGPSLSPTIPLHSSESGYYCSRCKEELTEDIGAGDNCPHCGVFISEAVRPDGKREIAFDPSQTRRSSQSSSSRTRVSGRGLRSLVRLGLFVVLGIGGLFAKLFSGNRRS